MLPRVQILLASYNGAAHLTEQLESLAAPMPLNILDRQFAATRQNGLPP